MKEPQIDIIPSHKIDRQKWNNCIHDSNSPLIYAQSFYLDHVADNWDGIVLNDYEVVMPVPWRKKAGIRYCYDVPFVQQLGYFSSSSAEKYHALLIDQLFAFCKYGNYNFNYKNRFESAKSCTNYILELATGYEKINERYNDDLLNNLKKAMKQSFIYREESYEIAIDMYKELYGKRLPALMEKDYENFKKLCSYLIQQGDIVVRKVSNMNNDLLAVALLLKDRHRLYNLMNSTTDAGKKTGANYFLYDQVFSEFASSNFLFDFEGSDIPGVKSFYEKFGAVNQPYYRLHFNRLPFPLKLLKR